MPTGVYKHKKGYKRPPFSKEWRNKISETNKRKGIKPPSYWKGKKLSEEHKKKISETEKGKQPKNSINWKGKNHPNWKGGITPKHIKIRQSVESRLWREVVFARDNWTCQKCKTRKGSLNAHHIRNFAQYPELRFAIDNGITLCEKCHREFHKKYSKRNNTPEQLKEFLRKT